MSWSITKVGKPEALTRAVDKEVEIYSGQSKEEFVAVAPHLKGLLDSCDGEQVMSLVASGHATFVNGQRTYAYLDVAIKQLGALAE